MTAHRHKGLNGKWLTVLGGDGAHGHPEIEEQMTTLAGRLALIEGRLTALELPAPPVEPEPPEPPINLQTAIDATPVDGTLDCGGGTYSGRFTVSKKMTLKNAIINGPSTHGTYVLTVTGDDATIEDVEIDGGYIGIGLKGCSGVTVTAGCYVHDVVYAGILTLSATDCTIDGNTIDGVSPVDDSDNWNAYGIAVSNLSGQPKSSGIVVNGNDVSNVHTWHGLDTHGGVNCEFTNNTVWACRRAIFLTSSPTNVLCDGNDLTAPTPAEQADIPEGCPVAYGTDYRGISVAGGSGTISDNVGHNYASGHWWNPISGAGGYTFSGNSPAIP